jgi:hypothetical protein
MARTVLTAAVLAVLTALTLTAQSGSGALRSRVAARFEILPIANGLVLTPRFRTSVKTIELSDSRIAIDGLPATGSEVRERLGADADLVLQLSYLTPEARRSLARGEPQPSAETAPQPVEPAAPTMDSRDAEPERPSIPRPRRREDIVRIGGSVTVDADESVHGDVVAVGGSAEVNGEVDGDVVVVGGRAVFGPQAYVRGDVTAVGGGVQRHPDATIRGGINEVGFGEFPWAGGWSRRGDWDWDWTDGFYPVARLTGTLVRVALLALLTALVLFVARQPVEQIADRVADEPVKSWFVGFLAEMLFFPALILSVVVLAISIIGIPLLLLVPVAIVAALVVMLVGFTAVAYQTGRLLQQRVDALRTRPYAATIAGILLIVSPVLLARLVGLTGELWFLVWPIAAVGFLFEYIAWTAGLGAAALVRFGGRPSVPAPPSTTPAIVG